MNNCQNSNSENNSCTPCVGCEDVISSDCVSVQSTISCIDMSAGDNLTSVLTLLGEAVCNFYSFIDSGSGLTVSEVDGSPSYAAINLLRFNQDSGFIVTQPSANTADVRLIPIFLFPDETYITVDMVTTGNITLANLQNLDGQTGVAGSRVLVWKQTIKTENGVYAQVNLGAWTRTTDSDTTGELNNQVVFASYPKAGSQYGGKYFNQIVVSPVIGSDNIVYQLPPSGNKQAWLLDGNDNGGVEKWLGTISNNDLPLRTNNTELSRLFSTGELGIGITSTPLGTLHVKGKGSSQSPLYVTNNAVDHSLEFRDGGYIFRNNILHSVEVDVAEQNTSWGYNSLNTTLTGTQNTAVGYQCGKSLTTGSNNVLFGINAGYALTTGGHNMLYGYYAGGALTTGYENSFFGSTSGAVATTANDNSGFGVSTLNHLTTGAFNTALGGICGTAITTGSNNTFVGCYSGVGLGTSSGNNIAIGNSAGFRTTAAVVNFSTYIGISTVSEGSNEVVLGGQQIANFYFGAGKFNSTAERVNINFQPNSAVSGSSYYTNEVDGNGINWSFSVSQATGSGTSGDIIWKYAPSGASGSTLTTLTTGMTFKGSNGTLGIGLSPTKGYLELKGGTTTLAPLVLTSGTNNTTAQPGAIEYNGTNLFFTRTGTTREGILTQSAITTEVVVSDTTVTVNIGGVTYKLLARA